MKYIIQKEPSEFKKIISSKYSHYFYIALLVLLIIGSFHRVAIPGTVGAKYDQSAVLDKIYSEAEGDSSKVYWNAGIMSGVPRNSKDYLPKGFYVNTIVKNLIPFLDWKISILVFAALGMYYLIFLFGFDPIISFISGLGYALSGHFLNLVNLCNEQMLISASLIPWIFLAIYMLRKKRSVLWLGLTSLFFVMLVREGSIDIIINLTIFVLIYWITNLVWAVIDKTFKDFILFTFFLIIAVGLPMVAFAYPMLSIIDLKQLVSERIFIVDSGLNIDSIGVYFMNFFGIFSRAYWIGESGANVSSYFGVLITFLAFIGVLFSRKRAMAFFSVTGLVFFVLSLLAGKLSAIPYGNYVNIESFAYSSVIILSFSVTIASMYGLNKVMESLYELRKEIFVVGLLISSILLVSLSGFIFLTSESNVNAQITMNALISLSLITAFFLITVIVRRNDDLEDKFFVLIVVLIMLDMIVNTQIDQSKHHLEHKHNYVSLKKTNVDHFLAADTTFFRVYPLNGEFVNNRWGLYGRTIGGTSNQYYKKYTDFLSKTLHKSIRYRDPFNWNVLNMLGVKYIINNERVQSTNLKFAYYDKNNGQSVYKNIAVLPHSWYPKNVEFADNDETIAGKLSSFNYDAKNVVLSTVDIKDVKYHKKNKITSERVYFDSLIVNVQNKTRSLLVMSEIYYPNNWVADIDGIATEIIPVNSILRGIVVDKGDHVIKMKFKVPLIVGWRKYNLIGMFFPLILIMIGIYLDIRSKFKGEIEYVLKYYE